MELNLHPEQHCPAGHLLLTIGPQFSWGPATVAGAAGLGGRERVGSQAP